jgi:hypothetical protein
MALMPDVARPLQLYTVVAAKSYAIRRNQGLIEDNWLAVLGEQVFYGNRTIHP